MATKRYKAIRATVKAAQSRRVVKLTDSYVYSSMDTERTQVRCGLFSDGSGYLRVFRDGTLTNEVFLEKETIHAPTIPQTEEPTQ